MTAYRIENSIVKTENAIKKWIEHSYHDGHNFISVATGSQWHHETLYRSTKGRHYVVRTSDLQGSGAGHAEWVSPEEAARWLGVNQHDIPAELQAAADSVTE